MALASTAFFAGPRRSALRGRAVVPRAVSDNAKDDVASSSGTPSRRGVLFGSLAATIALPAVAATQAKPMSPVDAFITLMDGRDALTAAMELRGTEGGKRMRVRNLLPRYSDKAKTMTAVLPVTIATSFGEVVDVGVGVDGDGDGAVPANGLGAMEDVLLGAKNLTVLAKYVADGTPFGEEEVPQASFAAAVEACDRIIEAAPADVMKKASGERCRRLISSAVDMEEMKTFAASPACDNYGK